MTNDDNLKDGTSSVDINKCVSTCVHVCMCMCTVLYTTLHDEAFASVICEIVRYDNWVKL